MIRAMKRVLMMAALSPVLTGAVVGVFLASASGAASRQAERAAALYSEQQGHHGVNTFTNYHNASGMGPSIGAGAWVQVSCKVYDPYIQSVNPDGYWYRIASSPWNDAYYSPANTFMNGDPWNGPYTHNTDFNVPDCGAPAPTPAPAPPPAPSITASIGGGYGCASCNALNITVHDFPTGTYTYECHDNSGPGGGDSRFYSHAVSVTDPNQSTWPGVFCYDSAPYTAYLVMNGVRSNSVTFSGAAAGPPTSTSPGDGSAPPAPPGPSSQPSPEASIPGGAALYFSPYKSDSEGHGFGFIRTNKNWLGRQNWGFYPAPTGTQTVSREAWDGNHDAAGCPTPASLVQSTKQAATTGIFGGQSFTTVGSWSASRVIPFVLLGAQSQTSWIGNINYILMFDPEGTVEFGSRNCLKKNSLTQAVRQWLTNPAHHLVIFAGADTIQKGTLSKDGHGHAGIQDALFPALKTGSGSSAIRKRVVVCDYDGMAHWEVWANFRGSLTQAQITLSTCPKDPRKGHKVSSWNP
jgi:hypothetical protein